MKKLPYTHNTSVIIMKQENAENLTEVNPSAYILVEK